MLLPPDLRDWIGKDDLVHFVIEAVERLPMESFKINHRADALREQLARDIKGLLEKADETSEAPQALPKEISRLDTLKAKMDKACAELKQRGEERREEAQKASEMMDIVRGKGNAASEPEIDRFV